MPDPNFVVPPRGSDGPGYFQQEFDKFAKACFANISHQQYVDLRRTFMAGASAFMFVSTSLIDPDGEPTEVELDMVTGLARELVDFNYAVGRREK